MSEKRYHTGVLKSHRGVSTWDNSPTTKSAPSQRELTQGDDHYPAKDK